MSLRSAAPALRAALCSMACAVLAACGGADGGSQADADVNTDAQARVGVATATLPTDTVDTSAIASDITLATSGGAVDPASASSVNTLPEPLQAESLPGALLLAGPSATSFTGTGVGRVSAGCVPTEYTDFIDKTFWVFRRLLPRDCRIVMDNPVSFSWTQPKDRNTAQPWVLRVYNAAGTIVTTQSLASPRTTLASALPIGKYTWTVSYVTTGSVTRTSTARRFEVNATTTTAVMPTAAQLLSALTARTAPRVLPAGSTWAGITAKAKAGEYANPYSMLSRTANTSVLAPLTVSPESRTKASFASDGEYVKWLLALMQQTNDEVRHLEVLSYAWRFTGNSAYAVAAKARLMNLVAWNPNGASSEASQPQANRNLYLALAMGYDLIGSELSSAEKTQLITAFNVRLGAAMGSLAQLDAEPYLGFQNTGIHYITRSLLHVAGAPGFASANTWLTKVWPLFLAQFQVQGEEDGGYAGSVAYAWYDVPIMSKTLATLTLTASLDLSR